MRGKIMKNSHETTINLKEEDYQFLENLADVSGIPKNKIIKRSVKKLCNKIYKLKFTESLMTYQAKHHSWEKPHYNMSHKEYDVYLDIKKIIRLSFSHLVAIAIRLFGDDATRESELDSYQHESYCKNYSIQNSKNCLYISWNLDQTDEKIIKPPG
jgi:predicted DNA-binding protein